MNGSTEQPALEHNPITHARHRRESIRQIWIPLTLLVLVFLTLGILAITTSQAQASQLADISLVWLIVPAMLFALITLIIMAGLTFAIIKLIQVIPGLMFRIQNFLVLVNYRVGQAGDMAVKPFIKAQGFTARMQYLGKKIKRNNS